jgi:hypothetical protein
VGHVAWTTALLIGAPIALWKLFGWPLPTQLPDVAEVVSTPLNLVDPKVILNFFVCAAWLSWMTIAGYLVIDIADAAHGLSLRRHRLVPLGAVAGRLVASIALLATLARPAAASAAPPLPPPISQVIDFQPPITGMPVAPVPAPIVLAAPIATQAADTSTSPVYVVRRGDNLWDIAQNHLGSGFRWTEIHDLNRELIADPDLICIGWQLTMPADAVDVIPAPAVVPVASASVPVEVPTPSEPPPAPVTSEYESAPSQHPSPDRATPTVHGALVEMPAVLGDRVVEQDSMQADRPLPALFEAVPGITGATVLATSLLLLLRKANERRARLGSAFRRVIPPLERTIVAASDVPLVRWAGQELAYLGEQLAGRRDLSNPVALEFSEESGMELLWDRPVPGAPRPWEEVPGAWAWRTLYEPDGPVPMLERPPLISGLVTFGTREGKQFMVNLEALGTLSVTGDEEGVEGFLRSIAVELGSGDELSDATVTVTRELCHLVTTEGLPRLRVSNRHDAFDHIETTCRAMAAQLNDEESTFATRLAAKPIAPLEVQVLVASADDGPQRGVLPNCGVAVVLSGSANASNAEVHIDADGTARLEPLGVTFNPAQLHRTTEAAVADLLSDDPTDVDDSTADDVDLVELMLAECETHEYDEPASGHTAAMPTIDLRDEPDQGAIDALFSPRMLIRVLGEPTIVDGPIIGRRELIAIVRIACLDRPARLEDIQEAVWGGQPVVPRTIWNLMGRARKQLGDWDGEPILRTALRPHNTYSLADGVATDLEIVRAVHQRASAAPTQEAIALLARALDLVAGPPFGASGYEWAGVGQLTSEAECLIESCVLQVVRRSGEHADNEPVRHAIRCGLRALPGNEALYRERFRVEAAVGNLTGVRTAFRELDDHLRTLGIEPSEESCELVDVLTRR